MAESKKVVVDRQTHYAGLDLLRIVAAYLVLCNHFGQYNPHYDIHAHGTVEGGPLAFPFLAPFSGVGSVGVEVFFVISGFVITASVRNVTPMEFLIRRVVRVFPALWICMSVNFLVRASSGESLHYLLGCWFRSMVLSPIGPHIDGVIWTLVVEAVFYAAIFFFLMFVPTRPLDKLEKIIGFSSVAFLSLCAYARITDLHMGATSLLPVLDRFPFKFFLLRDGVFFALGMLFWRWMDEGRPRSCIPRLALYGSFGLVEIICSSLNPLVATIVTAAIWLIGMVWLYCSVRYSGRIAELTLPYRRSFGHLGRLSYTLYLGHYVIGMVLVSLLFSLKLGEAASFVIAVSLITALAWIIMIEPERFLQRAMKAKFEAWNDMLQRHFRKRRVEEAA